MTNFTKCITGLFFAFMFSCTFCACNGKSQQHNPPASEVPKEEDIDSDSLIITTIQTEEDTTDYEQEWIHKIESSPQISDLEAKRLQPHLKEWLNYHALNIQDARDSEIQENIVKYNSLDSSSLYFRKYTIEDDISNSPLFDYSPNKRKYVSLGIIADKEDDGNIYYYGWDDCQAVYLTDRDKKQNYMIAWEGSGSLNLGTFWINNDQFILVGEYFNMNTYFFKVFDLNKSLMQLYNIIDKRTDGNKKNNYFKDVYLKKKNIRAYQS